MPRIARRRILQAALAAGAGLLHTGLAPRASASTVASPGAAAAANFSEVASAGPDEVIDYFAGRHPRYPGAGLGNYIGYSAANILEAMDTEALDAVGDTYGPGAVAALEQIVARTLLEALLRTYGDLPVVLALDAGHGGNPSVYYDPGSNATEAVRAREVVRAVESTAREARYGSIVIRRIFNDEIGDEFGLPPDLDCRLRASLVLRNARASMLAFEANVWNQVFPDQQIAVHLVSVHFNAGSGGVLALHQGSGVPASFENRSIAYARSFVDGAWPQLNGSGLLRSRLRLAGDLGLHDDTVMYTTPFRRGPLNPFTGADRTAFPDVYGMLEGSLLEQDYMLGVLRYHRFV